MIYEEAITILLTHQYLVGFLDPFITLREVHRLLYLLQEMDEPLHLKFVMKADGIYAQNPYNMLVATKIYGIGEPLEITYLFETGKPPELAPGMLGEACSTLSDETREKIGKIGQLIHGFESPYGIELLTSVHWILTHDLQAKWITTVEDIQLAWNHKPRFPSGQIDLAMKRLKEK